MRAIDLAQSVDLEERNKVILLIVHWNNNIYIEHILCAEYYT